MKTSGVATENRTPRVVAFLHVSATDALEGHPMEEETTVLGCCVPLWPVNNLMR
jgi:hypothetical protein